MEGRRQRVALRAAERIFARQRRRPLRRVLLLPHLRPQRQDQAVHGLLEFHGDLVADHVIQQALDRLANGQGQLRHNRQDNQAVQVVLQAVADNQLQPAAIPQRALARLANAPRRTLAGLAFLLYLAFSALTRTDPLGLSASTFELGGNLAMTVPALASPVLAAAGRQFPMVQGVLDAVTPFIPSGTVANFIGDQYARRVHLPWAPRFGVNSTRLPSNPALPYNTYLEQHGLSPRPALMMSEDPDPEPEFNADTANQYSDENVNQPSYTMNENPHYNPYRGSGL